MQNVSKVNDEKIERKYRAGPHHLPQQHSLQWQSVEFRVIIYIPSLKDVVILLNPVVMNVVATQPPKSDCLIVRRILHF